MSEEYEEDYEDEFEEDEEEPPPKVLPKSPPKKPAAKTPAKSAIKTPKEPATPENLPAHVLEMRKFTEEENKRANERARDKELVPP